MTRRILPIFALCLLSCGQQSQVTITLQAVLAAAQVVIPLIPGVSPQWQTQLRTYLSAVSDGVSQTTVILASNDAPSVQASKILMMFRSIAVPVLSPSTPPKVMIAISAVVEAVQAFLAVVAPIAKAVTSQQRLTLTPGDLSALPKIGKAAVALKERAAK
jgi:hypothetical protein